MSLYKKDKLQELKDEERRLEEQLAFVRDQIRNIEYQRPHKGYTIPHDFDYPPRVRFGDDKND